MEPQVFTGAAMVAAAAPLVWWAVSSSRSGGRDVAATLTRGMPVVDMRTSALERPARERAVQPVVNALAARARKLTPVGMLTTLENRLVAAGAQGRVTLEQVLAVKLLLGVTGVLITGLRLAAAPSLFNVIIAVVGTAFGWFLPDIILGGRADERRKKVRRELADTMDQITIAVEAGLGFEAAMARVAEGGPGVLAQELSRVLQDIRLGVARSEALEGLAARCDLAELRHFVSSIRQAERYGLPIAKVLRVQASELRDKRRQAAEEHAMKIPVKVLFPLVFCILPALFIVVIGPGAIRIMESM
jgi:tight adherence protein C